MPENKKMAWFRLYSEIHRDTKLILFNPGQKWAFVVLLCLASESKHRGTIEDLSDEEIALVVQMSMDDWLFFKDRLIRKGMVEINRDGDLVITHWQERQYDSDNSTERVRKHRENREPREPLLARNVSETGRNVSETFQKRAQRSDPDPDPDPDPDLEKTTTKQPTRLRTREERSQGAKEEEVELEVGWLDKISSFSETRTLERLQAVYGARSCWTTQLCVTLRKAGPEQTRGALDWFDEQAALSRANPKVRAIERPAGLLTWAIVYATQPTPAWVDQQKRSGEQAAAQQRREQADREREAEIAEMHRDLPPQRYPDRSQVGVLRRLCFPQGPGHPQEQTCG